MERLAWDSKPSRFLLEFKNFGKLIWELASNGSPALYEYDRDKDNVRGIIDV